MKRVIQATIILILITTQTFAEEFKKVGKDELNKIRDLYILKKAEIEVKQAFDTGSILILDATFRGQPQPLYLTKDKNTLISGNALDANNGDTVSLPIDVSTTKGEEAFTFGSGKDEYILFTDLECPYCKKFESYFDELEKHIKIRVFLYPLDFHKNAKDLSIFVLSQPNQKEMIETFLTVNKNTKEFKNRKIDKQLEKKLKEKLNKQIKLAKELNVTGTPTIFDNEGKKVVWTTILEKYDIELK